MSAPLAAAVRRPEPTRAAAAAPAATKGPRRRRFIDPTTCERDYGADEVEFMQALERYKRTSGRMFPTCSEVLEVLRGLGYERVPRG